MRATIDRLQADVDSLEADLVMLAGRRAWTLRPDAQERLVDMSRRLERMRIDLASMRVMAKQNDKSDTPK
jgi:hypothetical protein